MRKHIRPLLPQLVPLCGVDSNHSKGASSQSRTHREQSRAYKKPVSLTSEVSHQLYSALIVVEYRNHFAMSEQKPPLPPFTRETAQIKVKAAQDAWNTM